MPDIVGTWSRPGGELELCSQKKGMPELILGWEIRHWIESVSGRTTYKVYGCFLLILFVTVWMLCVV